MVKLRLRRMGKKNFPFYRIVAVDKTKKRDGKYIESIGTYNPNVEPMELNIDSELAIKWINNGAQPSDTVRSLLRRAGILQKIHEEKNQSN